jgi:histidinol dehydrogenase
VRSPAIVEATAPDLESFFASGWEPGAEVVASVGEVLAGVRARGDDAVVEYARRWDDPTWALESLRVAIPPLEAAGNLVPPEIACALHVARERVARFHARQRRADIAYDEDDGTHYAFVTRPLAAVAAYVPGGSAPLPSTAIMTVVPAKLAGVERIVVLTPPQRGGGVNPAVVYACALCGADELYAVGGAQAVGAAAYGTASIARVDKIVGPGNIWVTEAKRQVAGVCAIDGLAGPSEVLVVADAAASPELIAGELLAQAEHDPQARVAAVSKSRATLERVAAALAATDASMLARGEIIAGVIERRCRLIHAATFDQLCEIVERFAPEHLSLRLDAPERILERVRRAGAVFVGEATPVACGDYLAGSNHVLPTSGSARFASGLSLADFTRTLTVVRNSDVRMRGDADAIAALAEFEGLEQHARTARMAAQRLT